MTEPRQPPSGPVVLAVLLAFGTVMVGLSVLVCWQPASDILELRRLARWPVVQATITAPHVEYRHFAEARHQPAMNAWCAGWDYDYAWQGRHLGGVLEDTTSGLLAQGCFVYEAGARNAASRRPPGSVVAVRVDPADPWKSTTRSTDIPSGDLLQLTAGCAPLLLVAALIRVALTRPRAGGSALTASRAPRSR